MAGALPAWGLEWFEREAIVWTSVEARRQELAVGLRHGGERLCITLAGDRCGEPRASRRAMAIVLPNEG
jgi:hypothetical protein